MTDFRDLQVGDAVIYRSRWTNREYEGDIIDETPRTWVVAQFDPMLAPITFWKTSGEASTRANREYVLMGRVE